MKKLLLLLFVTVLTATKSFADYGWYDVSMTIGGVTTDPSAWSTDFSKPTDLGIVTDMTITSIAFKVWSDANDRVGANMFFKVYDSDGTKKGDEDVDIFLGLATRIPNTTHDYSINWSGTEVNLAEAVGLTLEPGKTYYIDIYAKTYGDAGDEWYSGGGANFHAKLTYGYTRNVTSGNFGTICLPFAATVEGATIFKIKNKVMDGSTLKGINLESVSSMEAGKAYIFKATSSTLTATLSGDYTDASAGYGMMGNISSTKETVTPGYYIVKDNQIRLVGDGSTVTCGQYRGYITLADIAPATARSANFMGFEDETTGIANVDVNANDNIDANAPMYNLAGQRVSKNYKGVVIVNGKKVVLK